MNFTNAKYIGKNKNLQGLISDSFLQPWFFETLYIEVELSRNTYDIESLDVSALLVDNNLLLFTETKTSIENPTGEYKQRLLHIHKNQINHAKKKLLSASKKIKQSTYIYHPKNIAVPIKIPTDLNIHLICVSGMQIKQDKQNFHIKHQYSLEDVQDNNETICYFSTLRFVNTLKLFHTCYDFIDFIDYYQSQIQFGSYFSSEGILLLKYVGSGNIFQRAKRCEQVLIEQKIYTTSHIILRNQNPNQQRKHVIYVQENSIIWLDIISTYAEQISQGMNNSKKTLSTLMLENDYSRFMLSQCIIDSFSKIIYGNTNNFIVHIRSYSNPHTHYAFVFIANNDTISKELLDNYLYTLAKNINMQIIGLQDIVVIAVLETEHSASQKEMAIQFASISNDD